MSKKIAVLVRDKQTEALRMCLGLILMDDIIDIYMLDRKVEDSDENRANIETMRDLEMNMYTNNRDNEEMHYLTTVEIAQRLLAYDLVIPY